MKLKRIVSLGLVCALLLFPAEGALKDKILDRTRILWEKETELTETVTLTECVFDNGERQNEHYITYEPNTNVLPMTAFGETITQRLTLPEMEEVEEGRRFIAAVNGDYFVMATGVPLGIVLQEHSLESSDDGHYAFGFMDDGTAVFGKPGLKLTFRVGTETYRIQGVNKTLESGGFYLYSSAWGEDTGANTETWNVVLRPKTPFGLTIDSDSVFQIEDCYRSDKPAIIPTGRYVLCLTTDSDDWRLDGVKELKYGSQLTIEPSLADESFEGCSNAMGCLYPLVRNGVIVDDLEETDRTKAPRTAVGIREDGSVLFYTVDGRQKGYSEGLTLEETARRLLDLGCVDAGTMDGGASTVLGAQLPGEDDCAVRNRPSNGQMREVPVYLALVGKQRSSKKLKTLSVNSEAAALLTGTEIQLTAGGCDECGTPVRLKEVEWDCDRGDITEDGLFRAPKSECTADITVTVGDVEGELSIPIVSQPDTFLLMEEETRQEVTELTMRVGESIDLTADVFWEGLQVWASDETLDWFVMGDVGVITEDGKFTAGGEGGMGLIRVSAGKANKQITVKVIGEVSAADTFEDVSSGTTQGLKWSGERLRDKVKYGFGSLKLEYDLEEGTVSFPMDKYETELMPYGSLWVWTDGSANRLYARYENETILLDSMEHTGWRLMRLNPGTYGKLEALEVRGEGSGTLWLDQLILSENEADTEAPVLSLEMNGTLVFASVKDLEDSEIPQSRISLTLDGTALEFGYEPETGAILAALDELPKQPSRLTLTATDRFGNIGSTGILLGGTEPGPFSDMAGHWAESYVNHLAATGVTSGRDDGNGGLTFDPDSPITRAEFAVMLCRWLKVDTGSYAQELGKFTDSEEIPDWARPSAAAAASMGLIQGAAAVDGLYFLPQDTLTRAQAAVILGRTMAGGRMGSDLPFEDAEQIPSWAASYISQLAFMGVMRGDGVNFSPNGQLTRAQTAKMLSELS